MAGEQQEQEAEFWARTSAEDFEYYAVLNVSRDAPDDEVRRAYRSLAQAYHPDKHMDPVSKARAQEAFGKLQEAYEVLSDPGRRQVYDVYGKAGLEAGFEVGPRLDSVDELKKKWEEFKQKQESARAEAASHHRGVYTCRMDLSDLPASLAGARPLIRSVAALNSVDVPLGEEDALSVQGQAALRNGVGASAGAGNLIFGYRRVLSPHDTLDLGAVLGPRCALTATSTRQLTPYTSAALTTSYHAGTGVGMQLSSTRQLPFNCSATLSWVVGPAAASGISLTVTKRGARYAVLGKLELGVVTSLSARATYNLPPASYVRAMGRLGTNGIDLEVGAGRKWGTSTAGYLGTLVGLQGVHVKGRLVRGGQTLEVPMVLSDRPSDLRALAIALVVPPLACLASSRLVVRPLLRWHRARRERRQQAEQADAVRAAVGKAAAEAALVGPVARRRARAEAAKRGGGGGLVVLDAVYGRPGPYLAEGGPQQRAMAAAAAAAADGSAEAQEGGGAGAPALSGAAAPLGSGLAASGAEAAAAPTGVAAAAAGEAAGSGADAGGTTAGGTPPPPQQQPWLPVTTALQYLVAESRLQLHPGVPKKHQMAFADPTPGAEGVRQLYMAYLYGSKVYEVTVDDTDALVLPGAGEAVADAGRARGLVQLGAAALELPELTQPVPGGAAAGGGGAGGATGATPGPSPRAA